MGINVSSQRLELTSKERTRPSEWLMTGRHRRAGQPGTGSPAVTPALVVLEATDGYEFEAGGALRTAGLAVALLNLRTARDFARARGALAKTTRSMHACWLPSPA
jgi:transposase